MPTELNTLDIEPTTPAQSSVIWMHGLGADAHDFEPIIPELRLPQALGVRFVFPNAPVRPVTINGGMRMRAWYDILSIDLPRREDSAGVRDSEQAIKALIQRETARGIPLERVLLAGFSQGGAMALHTALRYPEKLAGILALSCYIPLASTLAGERHPANQDIPIFMAHGLRDEVIPISYGNAAVKQLESLGYTPQWHPYAMGHEVNWQEIKDVGQWLAKTLA